MVRSLTYPLLLILLVWLTTLGTWEILRGEFLGIAYDSLAAHLLHGSIEVDPDAIAFERYDYRGKVFMYFGPFPALLRVLPNLIAPNYYGAWSRVSTIIATLLSAIAFGGIIARALTPNQSMTSRSKSWIVVAAPFLFALGTPIAFLVSTPNIYHEAVSWGLCGTLLSLWAVAEMAIDVKSRAKMLLIFSIGFALSLLSRLTTAIPAGLLMPFVYSRYAAPALQTNLSWFKLLRGLVPSSIVVLASCAFQLWYNYERFGSIWVFRDLSKYFFSKTHLGSDFAIARLPDALIHYFGISSRHFVDHPPFVRMVTSVYLRPELYVQTWREQTISLPLSASWLIIPGTIGAFYALTKPCNLLLRVALFATLLQALSVMAYFFISERYAAELVPFFVVGLFVFASQFRMTRIWRACLIAICVLSVSTTVSSAIRFHMLFNTSTPSSLRQPFESLFFPDVVKALVDTDAQMLSDLTPLSTQPAGVPAYPNRDLFSRPLKLLSHSSLKGLGMRAGSRISYEVPAEMSEFKAVVMLSERSVACNEITLTLEGRDQDERLLFELPIRSNTPEPISLSASIVGTQRLTLSLRQDVKSIYCESANLYAARFTRKQ